MGGGSAGGYSGGAGAGAGGGYGGEASQPAAAWSCCELTILCLACLMRSYPAVVLCIVVPVQI